MMMRKLLVLATCMVTLHLHGATSEEARRIVREAVELQGEPYSAERRERWAKQIVPPLKALEKDDKLSAYCEMMAEKFDDPNPEYVNFIIERLAAADAHDISTLGNQEALDWTRKMLREKGGKKGYDTMAAERYLERKGNASDLELVSRHRGNRRLATRAAGTNIVEWLDPIHTRSHYFDFLPSVTNTGPQALYARAILRSYWETLPEVTMRLDETRNMVYKDGTQIPAELLTMVVWFDEDGNPVCNVDLAKYGLTMPELDVPNKPKPKPKVATASLPSAEDEAQLTTNHYPLTTTADTPPNRLWPYALIPLFLCAGAVLWFIRKK